MATIGKSASATGTDAQTGFGGIDRKSLQPVYLEGGPGESTGGVAALPQPENGLLEQDRRAVQSRGEMAVVGGSFSAQIL